MLKEKARPAAVIVIILAVAVGVLTTLGAYGFLNEYGPTTGLWTDGARQGLSAGAVGLLAAGLLAVTAFTIGRRTTWVRVAAVAAVVLSVAGVVGAGALAASAKYDRMPKVPNCGAAESSGSPTAQTLQDAFAGIEHPGVFGASWNGQSGCGAELLNGSYADAAQHYRRALPAAGWTLTRDDAAELRATRNELLFVLKGACQPVTVEIVLAEPDLTHAC